MSNIFQNVITSNIQFLLSNEGPGCFLYLANRFGREILPLKEKNGFYSQYYLKLLGSQRGEIVCFGRDVGEIRNFQNLGNVGSGAMILGVFVLRDTIVSGDKFHIIKDDSSFRFYNRDATEKMGSSFATYNLTYGFQPF